MFEAFKIIIWLRQLLFELAFPPTAPTIRYEDNKSAIYISQKGHDEGRTKQHMDHLIRDLIKSDVITVKYMPTESVIADIHTKPVDSRMFSKLQIKLLGLLV